MTIFGSDASHWDSPDFSGAIGEGFDFFTHKAGGDGNDAELATWWRAMKPHRGQVLLGAYWVLRPDRTTSAATSADLFLARLDSQCPDWRDGPFILQADCEIWNGDSSTKPSKAYIKAFCAHLAAEMPKLRPIVYASWGQYGDSLTGLGYPLWNARYPISSPGPASSIYQRAGGDVGAGWDSYSGQTPAIWQFTESATLAGQTTCDANAFRGSLAALVALLAPGWEIDVDLTAQNLKDIAQAVASKIYADESTPTSGLAKLQAASEARIVAALTSVVQAIGTVQVTPQQLEAALLAALKQLAVESSTSTPANRE